MVRTSRRGRDNPGSTPGGDSLTCVQVTLPVLGSLGMCISFQLFLNQFLSLVRVANVQLSKRFGFQTLSIFLPAEVRSFSVFSGHVVLSGLVSQYSLERVVLNPTLSTPGHSLFFCATRVKAPK